VGGGSALGCWGYLHAAQEIAKQEQEMGQHYDVLASVSVLCKLLLLGCCSLFVDCLPVSCCAARGCRITLSDAASLCVGGSLSVAAVHWVAGATCTLLKKLYLVDVLFLTH
jgi:hypothetical protein